MKIIRLIFILFFLTSTLSGYSYDRLDLEYKQAIESGNVEKVKSIIKNGGDVNLEIENYWTPLKLAINGDNYEIVSLLLESGANPNKNTKKDFSFPLSDAVFACRINGKLDVRTITCLLEHGADPNLIYKTDKNLSNPMLTCLFCAEKDIMNMFLDYGGNVNIIIDDKSLPFHTIDRLPLYRNRWIERCEIVKILADRGINLRFKNKDGETAADYAVKLNCHNILHLLDIENKYQDIYFNNFDESKELLGEWVQYPNEKIEIDVSMIAAPMKVTKIARTSLIFESYNTGCLSQNNSEFSSFIWKIKKDVVFFKFYKDERDTSIAVDIQGSIDIKDGKLILKFGTQQISYVRNDTILNDSSDKNTPDKPDDH